MHTRTDKPTLEIVSDVVCPWCYIGKRRLGEALALLGPEVPLEICWRPYELNPRMPATGMDRETYYERKFGSAEYAGQLLANVAANARDAGIAMDYTKIAVIPNTRTAHRLIWYAGRYDRQDAVVDGLFQAYFVDGRDVGDTQVLTEVAAACGLERGLTERFLAGDEGIDAVEAEERAAHEAGIQGVPAFLLNGRFLFSGAQSPETISLAIGRALAKGL
jgi:predicted DsbA family dithiol-disulfide isomerase